jgi:hypothetical protein
MTLHSIEVEVRAEITNGYRLKVSVLDLGLYMDGFRVMRSDKNANGWWVQPPAVLARGKWRPTPEFNKSLTLWQEIEQACIEVVSEYIRNEPGATAQDDTPPPMFPDDQDYGSGKPRRYHE